MNENIPLPILDIVRNLTDKKQDVYHRLPYRTRLVDIQRLITDALNKYDAEYTQGKVGRKK